VPPGSAKNSPGPVKIPKLNQSFFTSYNPKYKLDSIETARNRTKSKRKMRSLREDSQQSHLGSTRLEPLAVRKSGKKSTDFHYDSSEDKAKFNIPDINEKHKRELSHATKNLDSKFKESRALASNSVNNSYISRSYKDDVNNRSHIVTENDSLLEGNINKNKYLTSVDKYKVEEIQRASQTNSIQKKILQANNFDLNPV